MIHTTQGSVIKAYKTLNRLCEEKMPGSPCLLPFFYKEEYKILLLFSGGERAGNIQRICERHGE